MGASFIVVLLGLGAADGAGGELADTTHPFPPSLGV